MVLDFKLSRTGLCPWGFRLTGGADFEQPLKVIKITENSVAEECGLKVDDVIVRINNVDITKMSHQMVHELIIGFSDNFVVGVEREDDFDSTVNPNNGVSPIDFNAYESYNDRPGSGMYSEISVNSAADSITAELEASKITEEHIAEIMSGEAELLKDHNVIGVNFQKIMPKANIFKSSEVFKHLNEEAMKTRFDKEKEVKRWTTFLQKPNRPIPKPKCEIDKPYQEPYRVRIVKQPKPACDPKHVAAPKTLSGHGLDNVQTNGLNGTPTLTNSELLETVDQSLAANVNELNAAIESKRNETIDTTDVDDDDVPSLLVCENTDELNESADDDSAETIEKDCNGDTDDHIEIERNSNEDNCFVANVPNEMENQLIANNPKLEKQLADVQKQLEALSHLPSTIQATLEAVTRQIAEIMPAFKIRTSVDISGSINEDESIQFTEQFDAERNVTEVNDHIRETTENEIITTDSVTNDVTFKEHSHATLELCTNEPTNPESASIGSKSTKLQCQPMPDMIEVLASNADEQVAKLKIEKVFKEQEEKWLREREHAQKEEQQRKTIAESAAKNAKNAKSNNGPRTPQERPVVLPGGRKWRNPKDAYNEEFIAEIISSQAELITGSTLGKYESPLLGYDDRINFSKYKKPEKDLSNLNRSEVLKLIHNNGVGSITGISERPEKLYAANDYVGHP